MLYGLRIAWCNVLQHVGSNSVCHSLSVFGHGAFYWPWCSRVRQWIPDVLEGPNFALLLLGQFWPNETIAHDTVASQSPRAAGWTSGGVKDVAEAELGCLLEISWQNLFRRGLWAGSEIRFRREESWKPGSKSLAQYVSSKKSLVNSGTQIYIKQLSPNQLEATYVVKEGEEYKLRVLPPRMKRLLSLRNSTEPPCLNQTAVLQMLRWASSFLFCIQATENPASAWTPWTASVGSLCLVPSHDSLCWAFPHASRWAD